MSNPGKWNVKLTDIFFDPGVCIAGANFCSCCIQAEAVHRVTNSGRCIPCCWIFYCCCLGRFINRRKIQKVLKMQSSCEDCLLSYYCPACTQCQEYNEVFSRYPPT